MQLIENKIILAIIFVILSTVKLESEGIIILWKQPHHFCGSQLTNALRQICRGHYVNPDPKERNKCRTKRHVVDECCHSPCTPHHLREHYCDNGCQKETRTYLDTSLEYIRPSDTDSSPTSSTTTTITTPTTITTTTPTTTTSTTTTTTTTTPKFDFSAALKRAGFKRVPSWEQSLLLNERKHPRGLGCSLCIYIH